MAHVLPYPRSDADLALHLPKLDPCPLGQRNASFRFNLTNRAVGKRAYPFSIRLVLQTPKIGTRRMPGNLGDWHRKVVCRGPRHMVRVELRIMIEHDHVFLYAEARGQPKLDPT